MDLVRSWLGQALRATGAAVVVPVAILVALSLTAIGGSGLGGLGALSQVISGPRTAGSGLTVDTGETEIGDAVTQLAAAGAPPGAGIPGTTPPGTSPGSDDGGGEVPGGDTSPPGGGDGPGDIDNDDGDGGDGGPEPPQPPPPRPPPPGVVEGVGETVKDVTDGTPVAPTVEDAVDGLVELCRGLGCP